MNNNTIFKKLGAKGVTYFKDKLNIWKEELEFDNRVPKILWNDYMKYG